ncbi:m-AAA protease-interacting protein 1, mitochondrial-like [Montipora capricornis]|uniref:m-AAA protease-interacting protein 1, mitochondrial-like n=1 Tax=Montipora foliosa TaxID=591990 RepID=UPI0035F1CC8C
MAVQSCFRRYHSFPIRCLTNAFIDSQAPLSKTRTIFRPSNFSPSLSCLNTRTFCSDKGRNDNQSEIKAASVTITQGPFGWLSKTVNLWFLKSFIDREFDEREFLRGAKQALCVVSEQLAKGNSDEMEGVLSENLLSDFRNKIHSQRVGPVVRKEEVLSANIQKVQLGLVENGRGKVVLIQVAFLCKATENENQLFERQMGNVKIIGIPVPKITYYTFRKFIFPDSVSDWQVDAITTSKLS